jgi:DNA-binding GntR family transcriptional regulator
VEIKFNMNSGTPEIARSARSSSKPSRPNSHKPVVELSTPGVNQWDAIAKEKRASVIAPLPMASTRLAAARASSAPRDPKLNQLVYEEILNAIVYGLLDLGEPLSENDLAGALKVSKAPIRYSLNKLRIEGLVVVVPQSGSYVFSPTREQIEELCDFRSLLEARAVAASMEKNARFLIADLRKIVTGMKQAIRLADVFRYKRLDTEFHQSLLRYCGNQFLIQSYSTISHRVEALRYRFMDTAIYRNLGFDEHKKIVELLAGNNVDKTIDVLRDHIARTRHFHSSLSWSTGRLRRKDYKFRDYSKIFSQK